MALRGTAAAHGIVLLPNIHLDSAHDFFPVSANLFRGRQENGAPKIPTP